MEVEILERLKTELESFRILNNAYLVGAASMIAYSTAYIFIIIARAIEVNRGGQGVRARNKGPSFKLGRRSKPVFSHRNSK